MKIYLDVCCLCRPFDDQLVPRIRYESEAVIAILNRCSRDWELVWSSVITYEVSKIIDHQKKNHLTSTAAKTTTNILVDRSIKERAAFFMGWGVKAVDALHVACAEQVFNDTLITSERLLKSLAQFTSMLITGNSHYDKYVRGEEKLTDQELTGLKLFMMHCETCHSDPLFTNQSFRNIGLKPDTALKDSGRIAVTGIASDYMKFKIPTLRNVELTAPYMHDGRFKSLQQVLDYYAKGDFYGNNYDDLIKRNVGMSESEKADIIAFLKTLTDKEFLYDRRFADPNFK